MNKEQEALEKAKNYAFLLLKYRQRSTEEIYSRLKKKKFDEAVIRQVVLFLRQRNFIDDVSFARSWIESRLRRGFGWRRIKQELRVKGIAPEIVANQFEDLKKIYSEQDEVKRIAQARLKRLKQIEPQKAKWRLFSYLARRGFSPELIMEAINQI